MKVVAAVEIQREMVARSICARDPILQGQTIEKWKNDPVTVVIVGRISSEPVSKPGAMLKSGINTAGICIDRCLAASRVQVGVGMSVAKEQAGNKVVREL